MTAAVVDEEDGGRSVPFAEKEEDAKKKEGNIWKTSRLALPDRPKLPNGHDDVPRRGQQGLCNVSGGDLIPSLRCFNASRPPWKAWVRLRRSITRRRRRGREKCWERGRRQRGIVMVEGKR